MQAFYVTGLDRPSRPPESASRVPAGLPLLPVAFFGMRACIQEVIHLFQTVCPRFSRVIIASSMSRQKISDPPLLVRAPTQSHSCLSLAIADLGSTRSAFHDDPRPELLANFYCCRSSYHPRDIGCHSTHLHETSDPKSVMDRRLYCSGGLGSFHVSLLFNVCLNTPVLTIIMMRRLASLRCRFQILSASLRDWALILAKYQSKNRACSSK